jgi:hypothetical protein
LKGHVCLKVYCEKTDREATLEEYEMKKILVVIALLLTGCQTAGYNESMLANGTTWKVNYGTNMGAFTGCYGYSSAESCINSAKPMIEQRAKELCGKEPKRVYACGRVGGFNKVECIIDCN